MNVLERIGLTGLIPVVVIENAEDAVPAAQALLDAGLDVMEITMRTPAGIEAIRRVRAALPQMLTGAGTVLSLEKCQEAAAAGAQFIVSPGINPEIVEWCIKNGIAVTPGCVTPTEIDTALSLGLHIVKFFPADVYGGVKGCAALYGPYQSAGIKFIPTGGINNDNLSDYADKPYIHAIGGGWLCKTSDIARHNFTTITDTAKKAVDILLGFEVASVGIHQDTAEASMAAARSFNAAFGFPIRASENASFAGNFLEITRQKGPGTRGHLVVSTNNISRAVHYLRHRGFEINMDTAALKGDRIVSLVLAEEFGGFAVRLVQK